MSSFLGFDRDYQEKAPFLRGFFYIRFLMKTFLKLIGVFAFASVVIAASFISYDFIKTREAFPPQTYIGKIDVSNLTQSEAVAKLKSFPLSEIFAPLITLEADIATFTFAPEQLGINLLYKQTIRKAFLQTHKGNYIEELKERISKGESYGSLILGIDNQALRAMLEIIANKIQSSPKDASIVFYEDTGAYHIEAEDVGRQIDIKKSMANFKKGLYEGNLLVPLSIDYSYPEISEKELRANPPIQRIGVYTTYYGAHDSPNRIHNIKLVASWIDGTLLMPGERFSVADVLGVVSPEKGFKRAFVIVGGELVPLLGGGSCQIATTLYNTVKLANLNVLERRNHSFYFNIYPLGRDAGVYPGQLDFKFENNSGYPILIKTVATDKKLSFRIYGTPSGKTVKFSGASILGRSSSGKYVPMSLRQVIAADIPFKTFVTVTVYDENGKQLKKETISSFYKLYGDKTNVPIRAPEPRQ